MRRAFGHTPPDGVIGFGVGSLSGVVLMPLFYVP